MSTKTQLLLALSLLASAACAGDQATKQTTASSAPSEVEPSASKPVLPSEAAQPFALIDAQGVKKTLATGCFDNSSPQWGVLISHSNANPCDVSPNDQGNLGFFSLVTCKGELDSTSGEFSDAPCPFPVPGQVLETEISAPNPNTGKGLFFAGQAKVKVLRHEPPFVVVHIEVIGAATKNPISPNATAQDGEMRILVGDSAKHFLSPDDWK